MQTPTEEQLAIVASPQTDLTLIQAYAGTGKTTTLRLIAESKPTTRILYICFGRENQQETERLFVGLRNVQAMTFDALAYHHFGENRKPGGLSKWIVMRELGTRSQDKAERVSNTILDFLANPDATYLRDPDADRLWRKLCNKETKCTNFAFLRKHLLLCCRGERGERGEPLAKRDPFENYDMLLVDECQDLNPVMLETLLLFGPGKPKVFVGDRFQHIFSFMVTVYVLKRLELIPGVVNCTLSESFRFGQPIADLASDIANSMMQQRAKIGVIGKDGSGEIKPYNGRPQLDSRRDKPITILAVKNQTLLKLAFEAAERGYTIHIVGRNEFLTLLEQEYRSVYVTHGSEVVRQKRDAAQWAENTDLFSVYNTILDYGSRLPANIARVKRCHVPRTNGPMYTFCTIHKSKGLEFNHVYLIDDLEVGRRGKEKNAAQLIESMNEKHRLYYVGATRAKCSVHFPRSLCKEFNIETFGPDSKTGDNTIIKFLSASKTINI